MGSSRLTICTWHLHHDFNFIGYLETMGHSLRHAFILANNNYVGMLGCMVYVCGIDLVCPHVHQTCDM